MADLQLIHVLRAFGFDCATLAGILLAARRCNVRDGITGSLTCREDLYLQLLEGAGAAVEACLARIGRDDRHLNVRLISRRMVTERLFLHRAMRDDLARSWMWSVKATAIFERLAREPDEAPSGRPMARA